MLPTSSGPTGSARFWGCPQSRAFAELLTDCDEDRVLRAVVVGMLREMGRSSLVRYACGIAQGRSGVNPFPASPVGDPP
jgi:hypothetical protein